MIKSLISIAICIGAYYILQKAGYIIEWKSCVSGMAIGVIGLSIMSIRV